MALLILTPFSINNFVQGRMLLGIGSAAIIVILGFNAWSIHRGRFPTALTLYALVPMVLVFLLIAIQRQGTIGLLWCYPAIFSFYMMLPERKAWVANAALLAMAIPVAWMTVDHALAIRVAATMFAVSMFAVILTRVITVQQDKLQMLAVTDPLTRVYNRVLLQDDLELVIEQHKRTQVPMLLLAMDLDHFKLINDGFGHEAGDAVLRGVGELLRERLRASDRVYRLGGEEFLVLLHGTELEAGLRVGAEICNAIREAPLLDGQPVSTSIGAAQLREGEDWNEWLRRADEKLYLAKELGRGRVEG